SFRDPPYRLSHRLLVEVSARSLGRCIPGRADGLLAGIPVGPLQLGQVAHPSEERPDPPLPLGRRDGHIDVLPDPRKSLEVSIDELRGLLDGDPLITRQTL